MTPPSRPGQPAPMSPEQQQMQRLQEQAAAQGLPGRPGGQQPPAIHSPSLPAPEVVREPARIKFNGRTYNIITKIADVDNKPSPGSQRAVAALIGTMLSHGIAALQSEHSIEIKTLNNLSIIESVPQGVEVEDADGKKTTKKEIELKLVYKYRKDGEVKTVIKDVLKLQDKDNATIDEAGPAHGHDDRRAIDTAKTAYLKAMDILQKDQTLHPDSLEVKHEPFNLTLSTLNSASLETYKPTTNKDEEKDKEATKAEEKDKATDPASDSAESTKTSKGPTTDEESSFSNPFALRDAEKQFDANAEKTTADKSKSKTKKSTESWKIPLYKKDDKDDPSWSEYLLKGIIKNDEDKIIAKTDKESHITEKKAHSILNKFLVKKSPLHVFRDPLNHLDKEEKRLLKRFILLYQKARYQKASLITRLTKTSEDRHFKEFTVQIISRLNPSTSDDIAKKRATDRIPKQAENLKQHIDKFCEKSANSDLRGFVQYIDDCIKRKRTTTSKRKKT